jgi:toxin FitB
VSKFLLDTNILSEAVKPRPDMALQEWMLGQRESSLYISTLSVAEIWRGILEKAPGRKRRELESWFRGAEGPSHLFRGRVLSFDERAAIIWGELMAEGRAKGRPRSALDMVIAAIGVANGCVIVSGNARHFEGLAVLNPMRT